MNKMIKVFKAEIHSYFKNMSENQSMRITGDCTPYYNNNKQTQKTASVKIRQTKGFKGAPEARP